MRHNNQCPFSRFITGKDSTTVQIDDQCELIIRVWGVGVAFLSIQGGRAGKTKRVPRTLARSVPSSLFSSWTGPIITTQQTWAPSFRNMLFEAWACTHQQIVVYLRLSALSPCCGLPDLTQEPRTTRQCGYPSMRWWASMYLSRDRCRKHHFRIVTCNHTFHKC